MSPDVSGWVIDGSFDSTLPESEFLALTKGQQSFIIKNIDILTGKDSV